MKKIFLLLAAACVTLSAAADEGMWMLPYLQKMNSKDMKARGYKVSMQKCDPYYNVDPGLLSPLQHGEAFITDDGVAADLDLGHYERFIDENLRGEASVTTGKVHKRIMEKEQAEELYRGFGKAYLQSENWQLYLLSSHTEFERCFGKTADKKRKLYNGMIKCDLFMYFK